MNIAPHFALAILTHKKEGDRPLVEWTRKVLSDSRIHVADEQIEKVLFQIADYFTLRGPEWLASSPKSSPRRLQMLRDLKRYSDTGVLKVILKREVEVVWDFA